MSTSTNRLSEIVATLSAARSAYYSTGTSPIEDSLYDKLEDELRTLAPDHPLLAEVGASEGILSKTKHGIPMGSLNKAMNRAELNRFCAEHPGPYHVTFKMDGGSVSLEYVDGTLVRAVTRGDGIEGEDITHSAIHFKDLPIKDVRVKAKPFTGFVRGEIILTTSAWKAVDPDLSSNPRNLAIGISKRKSDVSEAKNISIFAFRIFDKNGSEISPTEEIMHQTMSDAGFTVPEAFIASNANEVWEIVSDTEFRRSDLDFWIDGMVVSVNDIMGYQKTFSITPRPAWSVAVKFAARTYSTVLRSVEFNVGHTGKIVPVGKFDPVIIDGTEVKSALLCNWNVISALDIAAGDTVAIYKAGDIIPRVLEVTYRPINRIPIAEPTVCPVCGGPVGRKDGVHGNESADIFCLSEECPAKTEGKIMRYIRSLDIKEVGETVITTLLSTGAVTDIASLYRLKVSDIENAVSEGGKKIGTKTAKTIVENINAKKVLTIPELLGSIGIEHLGKGRVENIIEASNGAFTTLDDWFSGMLKMPTVAKKAGVPGLAESIQRSLDSKRELVNRMLSAGVAVAQWIPKNSVKIGAKKFTMTGALSKTRDAIIADIEKAGHIHDGSVSRGLDYLVMADPSSTSSKAVKARSLGIRTISEAEMYRILSGK